MFSSLTGTAGAGAGVVVALPELAGLATALLELSCFVMLAVVVLSGLGGVEVSGLVVFVVFVGVAVLSGLEGAWPGAGVMVTLSVFAGGRAVDVLDIFEEGLSTLGTTGVLLAEALPLSILAGTELVPLSALTGTDVVLSALGTTGTVTLSGLGVGVIVVLTGSTLGGAGVVVLSTGAVVVLSGFGVGAGVIGAGVGVGVSGFVSLLAGAVSVLLASTGT